MSGRGSSASQIHFILQLGYLKATSQFFNDKFDSMRNDIEFIIAKYFKDEKLNINAISSPSQKTCQSNQLLIAKELGYKIDISVITKQLQKMLESKIKLSGNPIYLFHEVLNYSAQNKMMLLSYSTLQDLIGKQITDNEKILSKLLMQYLTHLDWKLIDAVLNKNNNDEYIFV